MTIKKYNLASYIVLITLFFHVNISYAADTEKVYLSDLTGIWTDNNNNYFSIQAEEGMVLFIDLSRSLPRAEELERIGVEPKVEYLSHYGEAISKSLQEETLVLHPLVMLTEVFPEITRDIMDEPIRIEPYGFSYRIRMYNLCSQCSGDNSFERILYKVW